MPYQLFAEQIEEVRNRIGEPTAASVSNRWIGRLLNQGLFNMSRDVYLLNDTYSIPLVTNQQEYSLPENFVAITNCIFSFDIVHRALGQLDRDEILDTDLTYGDPESFALDIPRKKILLYPIPSVNSKTTLLNGALNATATTITVDSTTGFGAAGRIQVDNEVISYTGITATTFTGCIRGEQGTTAATHSDNAVTTWLELTMYVVRRPIQMSTNYSIGTIAVTNGSASIVGTTTAWSNGQNVYSGNYLGVGAASTTTAAETFPIVWYKILSVDSATGITLTAPYSEVSGSGKTYIITDRCEVYETECEIPILFAEFMIWNRLGNSEKMQLARDGYNYEILQAKNRVYGPDRLPEVKKTIYSLDIPPYYIGAKNSFYPAFRWQ